MGRPKDRASAAGLLPRMEARPWSDGKTVTYRYHPLGGKPINLGTDKHAALRQVLDITGERDIHGTLRWVWEQFTAEVDAKGKPIKTRWTKLTQGTRDDYRTAWRQIDAVFGDMPIASITPSMVARYVHIERADSPRRADIEKSLLSRLFGHGIKLGVCQVNATIGVEPHGSEPKTAAPPSDELLQAFTDWMAKQSPQTRVVGMAAEFASLAGNRQVEFLALRWEQIDDDAGEIRIVRAKQRGAKKGTVTEVISISEQLAELIARLRHLRRLRDVDCVYVFPTRDNCAYSARGFKTAWSRARAAAIEAGVITKAQRFTFHDLRAFYASKYKRLTKTLPDLHSNPATTARHYDRNKEVERSSL